MSATGTNGGSSVPLGTDELRAAVRAVLREVMPGAAAGPASSGSTVVLRTDADLDSFVRRVAAECADPARRTSYAEGRHGFRMHASSGLVGETSSMGDDPHTRPIAGNALRVERGAVTERVVKQAAARGVPIVVGRRAVLTPLARDRARALGVTIQKED